MKSRGMKHSNQVREFVITDKGLDLIDVYLGTEGVLTGSAREAQQLKEKTGEALWDHQLSRKDREVLRRKRILEAKIANLETEHESVEEELNKVYLEEELEKKILEENRQQLTKMRKDSDQNK
jgi:circadian clock protein KaiC